MIQALKVSAIIVLALSVVFVTQRALTHYLNEASANTGETVAFVIQKDEPIDDVATRLEDADLIRSSTYFRLKMRLANADSELQAGQFELHQGMTVNQIIDAITGGDDDQAVQVVEVRFQEGWRTEEYEDQLVKVGLISTPDEFKDAIEAGQWNYDFLASRPSGATLEGFLFPDTYQFRADAKPEDIIKTLLDTFNTKVPADLRARANDLGYNFFQVMAIASIVEREAVVPEERPIIASVYYNRITQGMTLDADPTVQYAFAQPGNWWPQVTPEMINQTIPYNTYRSPGFPPGPICNPSLASIEAALNPDQTDYLFFVAKGDGSGSHAFSTTYDEHLQNIEKYQGQ